MSVPQQPDAADFTVVENASLKTRNTFGVHATAARLIEIHHTAALSALRNTAEFGSRPWLVLGSGSNLLFVDDPDAIVIVLDQQGMHVVSDDGEHVVVRVDAGMLWHTLVMQTLAQGYCGLENLALIPGTVGAAPIQNIGAYGVELETLVHRVEAFDRDSGSLRNFDRDACEFDYRNSLFKRMPDRYVVTSVEFRLSHHVAPQLAYAGLADELGVMGIEAPTAKHVANAVIRIRQRKLPDPAQVGNVGSFFKNPFVPRALAETLSKQFAEMPRFSVKNDASTKLSAAWLIEACNWKGFRDGDAGVSDKHALVLVNYGHATGVQLFDLARRVASSVQERFGVRLEPEPRIVGGVW